MGWAAPGRSGPSRGRGASCVEPCIIENCQVLGEGGAQGDQAGAAHRAQAARHPLLRPGHDLLVSIVISRVTDTNTVMCHDVMMSWIQILSCVLMS